MKKIILISLGVIVLIIAGIGIYISMIDWNQHKARLSAQVSEILGKKVDFSGNLSVSYSLHPKISAQDVNIINPQNNETLAKISELETEVTLPSLIKGAPDIQSLYLVNSEFWVTLDENNVSNWHQQKDANAITSNEFLMQTINVVNSILHFKSQKYNVNFDLSAVNAEIRAETIDGPYRLDGNFMKGNERYGTAFSVDALSQIDDINTTFVIMHDGSDSYVRYDGSFNANNDSFKGFVKGDFKRTSDFINAVTDKDLLPEQYNQPLQFSVDANSDGKQLELSHFSVVFAQFMTGSGEILIPNKGENEEQTPITVKYQFRDIDFRPLAGLLTGYFEKARKGEKFTPNWHYDIDYDMSAVRVIVSDQPDGVFEDVSIKGTVRENTFNIDDFYAGCAGNIVMNLTGSMVLEEGVPLCSANIVADGRNFLALMKSLGYKLETPSQSAYQSGKITAGLKITPEAVNIEELTSTLDKAKVNMNMGISLKDNSYDIHLEADKLNLDNYIFPPQDDEAKNLKTIIVGDLNNIAKLKNKKVNLQANVGEAVWRGVSMKNLNIDAAYGEDTLTVNNISVDDMLESSGSVSAKVQKTSSSKPQFAETKFKLQTRNLMPLIKKWQLKLPDWPLFENKRLNAEGELNGNFDEITLKSSVYPESDSFDYNGKILFTNNLFRFDGNIVVKASRLDQLLSKFGVKVTDKAYRGVFNGKTVVRGNPKEFTLEESDFMIGSSQYTGSTVWKYMNNMYSISGNIEVNDMNLAQIIKVKELKNQIPDNIASNDTFLSKPELEKGNFDYSLFRKFNADITLKAQRAFYKSFTLNDLKVHLINTQGTLMLQNLSADLASSASIIGNAKLEYIKDPKIKGMLNWINLKLDNLGGSVYAVSTEDAKINLNFETSAQSFESLLFGLSGTAEVRMEGLKIKGIDLQAIEADLREREYSKGLFQMVQDNLQNGATEFNPLDANILLKDGVASLDGISLRNEYTGTVLSGSVNLKNWRINTSFDVRYPALPSIPPFSFSLSGALNKPIIDVSIGEVARKYDAHWDQIAQEEQAQKDKIKQELDDHTEQLRRRLINLSARVSGIIVVADNYISQEITAASANKYAVKKKRLNAMLEDIQTMQNRIGTEDIANDELIEVESQIQVLKQEVDIINDELKSYYTADINSGLESIMAKVNTEKSRCDQQAGEAEKIIGKNKAELEKIQEQNYLNDDREINRERTKVISSLNTANGIVNSFKEKHAQVSAMPEGQTKADEVLGLNEMYKQLQSRCDEIVRLKQNIEDLSGKLVSQRYAIYEQALLEAEKKRQAEAAEDEGNLLAESKKEPEAAVEPAPVAMPQPQAEEKTQPAPTEAENMPQPTVVPEVVAPQAVAPASNPLSGKIIRSYDDRIKPEPKKTTSSGILKPVEGAVAETSGTIIVK